MTCGIGNPGTGLGQAQKCGGDKLVNGNWNSNDNTDINKQIFF